LLDNTLDAQTLKQGSYGDENNWTESGRTLLEEKLNIEKKEVTVDAIPRVDKNLNDNEVTLSGDLNGDFEVADGVVTNNLLGLEADAYINDDDEIVYFDVTTSEKDIVVGTITAVDTANGANDITVQFADADDDDYTVATSGLTVYVNNESSTALDSLGAADVGLYGTFILNEDDEIVFADLYDFDVEGVIVKDVNESKGFVTGLLGTSDNYKVEIDDEDGYKIFLNGEEIALEDIEEGDVIYTADVNELDGDTYVYVWVIRNTVEGELEKAKNDEITVDGDAYDTAANVTYSLDNDDTDPAVYNDAEQLEDAMKEEVKAVLDIKGEVRHIVADVEETSDTLYGVVTKGDFLVNGNDAVKIYTKDDDEVTYVFDDDMISATNDIVSYELTNDGEIDVDNYTVIATGLTTGADREEVTVAALDDDKDYIEDDNGTRYYITDDTVIMSYYDGTVVDPAVVDWSDIEDSTVPSDLRAVIVTDDDGLNAEFVVFTDNYNLSTNGNSAFVIGDKYYDGDHKIDVQLFDGTEKTYVLEDKNVAIEEGDFVVFTTNQDGEMEDTVVRAVYDNYVATDADVQAVDSLYEMASGTVDTFTNDVIKLSPTESYKVLDTTAIYVLTLDSDGEYDEVDLGSTADIYDDATVRLIINDGDVEMVIVVEQ